MCQPTSALGQRLPTTLALEFGGFRQELKAEALGFYLSSISYNLGKSLTISEPPSP